MQGSTTAESTVNDTARFGIGIDMFSGTAEEAADRALTSVARKLDKALSVEYTVNELIAEATDPANLATVFSGMPSTKKCANFNTYHILRMEPTLLIPIFMYHDPHERGSGENLSPRNELAYIYFKHHRTNQAVFITG